MQTITKKTLVQTISRKNRVDPKSVQCIIQELLDYVTTSLSSGNRFEFRDFGIFEVIRRKQKIGRNPKSPETSIVIPKRNAVKFTPGKKLKLLVKKS